MPHCVAFNCNNESKKKKPDVSFHLIPDKNSRPLLRKSWTDAIGRTTLPATAYLCSTHFEDSCFDRSHELRMQLCGSRFKRKLLPDAVPTIFYHKPTKRVRDTSVKRAQKREHEENLENILKKTKDDGHDLELPTPSTETSITSKEIAIQTDSLFTDEKSSQCQNIIKEKSVQASTRMVSRGIQFNQKTKEIGIHCKTDTGDKEIQCFIEQPLQNKTTHEVDQETMDVPEFSESDDEKESDYLPSSQSTIESPQKDNKSMNDQQVYLVYEKQLRELLRFCPNCGGMVISESITEHKNGSLLTLKFNCLNGCNSTWKSQPEMSHCKGIGNVMLVSAISLSGLPFAKFKQFAFLLNLNHISENSFYRIRKHYVFPEIHKAWKEEQAQVIEDLLNRPEPVMLSADGRADSPGHSAKYGTYTAMDSETEKIVDFEVVQVTEVANSNAMELEGFKRVIARIEEEHCVRVKGVSTDRHIQVKKFMREKKPDKVHQLDPWHLIKNVSKKINKAAKKKSQAILSEWNKSIVNHFWWCIQTCDGDAEILVEKWKSIVHHCINKHSWPGSKHYKKCAHPRLTQSASRRKKWLKPGSPPHVFLRKLVTDTKLVNDLKLCTQCVSTSKLEVYHSLYLKYLPKLQHFTYHAMVAGTELAALDHNRNGNRKQVSLEGEDEEEVLFQYRIGWSKVTKKYTAKPVLEDKDYSYLKDVAAKVLGRVDKGERGIEDCVAPPTLAPAQKPSREDVIEKRNLFTRFK